MPLTGPPSTLGNVPSQRLADHQVVLRRRNRLTVDELEPAVVEEQQLVEFGVADLLLVGRNRIETRERDLDVRAASFGARLVSRSGRQECVRADPLDEEVRAELERHQRRDRCEHTIDLIRLQLLGDPLQFGEIVAFVERTHVGAVVRGEQHDHRLATEVVLERHVVDGDLRLGVEVAVLAGGELDVAGTDGEHDRDQRDDRRHDLPVLAERDAEPPPESFRLHCRSPWKSKVMRA